MLKTKFLWCFVLAFFGAGVAYGYNPNAVQITADTSSFSNNLSGADTTVQHALNTIDGFNAAKVTSTDDTTTNTTYYPLVHVGTGTGVVKTSTSKLTYNPSTGAFAATLFSGSGASLTSMTKSQVGLGNVDNTSDANKPVSTATQTALDAKVTANTAITGATNTKITYDSKGLVTAGAAATTADITDSTNKRYVTDANLTVIGNTSGTNTGDNAANSSTTHVGTTAIALNRASASQALTGITSIDGYAENVTGIVAVVNGGSGTNTATGTGAVVLSNSPVFTTRITTPSIVSSGTVEITPASGSNLNVNLATTGDFAVNTNQLYVDTSTGNVGIGTTSMGYKLQVSPVSQYTTINTGDAFSVYNSNLTSANLVVGLNGISSNVIQSRDGVSSSWPLSINPFGGNVGIGTTTVSAQLHTTGTVRFQNFGAGAVIFDADGNISSASDERLKTIEGEYSVGLKQLMGIVPIRYHWNELSGLDKDNLYTGFSAQNMRKFLPEAVSVDRHGYYNLQDRVVVAAMVNAIKDLVAEIDALRLSLGLAAVDRVPSDKSIYLSDVVRSGLCREKIECGEGEEVSCFDTQGKEVLYDGIIKENGRYFRLESPDEAKARYDLINQN